MAYNHFGDLPYDYPFNAVVAQLAHPDYRAMLHERAEEQSFLNEIGHQAVITAVGRIGTAADVAFADIGATLYEAATDTSLVGGDFAGTPTYRSPEAQNAAMWAAYTMECYTPSELYRVTGKALEYMPEDAPALTHLLEETTARAFGGTLTERELLGVKTGAALIRTVNVTGQHRLNGGRLENL